MASGVGTSARTDSSQKSTPPQSQYVFSDFEAQDNSELIGLSMRHLVSALLQTDESVGMDALAALTSEPSGEAVLTYLEALVRQTADGTVVRQLRERMRESGIPV